MHVALTAIHPFTDGNGRVARAVASAVLQQAIGLPLLIYADQRERYIRSLEAADNGNVRPPFIWSIPFVVTDGCVRTNGGI